MHLSTSFFHLHFQLCICYFANFLGQICCLAFRLWSHWVSSSPYLVLHVANLFTSSSGSIPTASSSPDNSLWWCCNFFRESAPSKRVFMAVWIMQPFQMPGTCKNLAAVGSRKVNWVWLTAGIYALGPLGLASSRRLCYWSAAWSVSSLPRIHRSIHHCELSSHALTDSSADECSWRTGFLGKWRTQTKLCLRS